MRRHAWLALTILGLAACGQGERATPGTTSDVGAAGAGSESPYGATCLEMSAAENWGEASRLCAMALASDPNDEKVKAALAAANEALAKEPNLPSDAGANASGEAAGEAADSGAQGAQESEQKRY